MIPPSGPEYEAMLDYKRKLEAAGYKTSPTAIRSKTIQQMMRDSRHYAVYLHWLEYQKHVQKVIESEAKRDEARSADLGENSTAAASIRAQQQQDSAGFENPPFDKRMRVYMPGNKPSTQGYIAQDSTVAKALGLVRPYRCRFLYNPEALSVNYRANDQVFPPNAQSADATAALALIPNMQHVSFDLFFDRTYEMNTHDAGMIPAHSRALWAGVYADIAALERVVGIENGQGPILKYPLNLYFGPRVTKKMWGRNSSMGGGGKPLQFYGFVDEMSVVYSLFDKDMVPVRARVSLGFTQMVKPKTGGFLPKIYETYGPTAAGTTEVVQ